MRPLRLTILYYSLLLYTTCSEDAPSLPNACGPRPGQIGIVTPTPYKCNRQLTICFNLWTIDGRGMPTSAMNFAHFAETDLGHKSVVLAGPNGGAGDTDPRRRSDFSQSNYDRICSRFPVRFYDRMEQFLEVAKEMECNIIYTQDNAGGENTGLRVFQGSGIKTIFHCMGWCHHRNGDLFAVTSSWMQAMYNQGPIIPLIVTECPRAQPGAPQKLRADRDIPIDAPLLCYLGSSGSFNLDSTRNALFKDEATTNDWLSKVPTLHLMFMPPQGGIPVHPRIHSVPANSSVDALAAYYATCDAMLHARSNGESFGMAVAEFSRCNKPVITMDNGIRGKAVDGYETAHVEMLGDKIWGYKPGDQSSMQRQFHRLVDEKSRWYIQEVNHNAYAKYAGPHVIKGPFHNHFIEPLGLCGDFHINHHNNESSRLSHHNNMLQL